MPVSTPIEASQSGSYEFLRRVVAAIAIALPIVTVGGASLDGDQLEGSISQYYYSRLGGYFVGSMCALGVIFAAYKHGAKDEYRLDNRLSNAAGLLAVMVGLVPTWSESGRTGGSKLAMYVHVGSAAMLLLILAYLALYRFTLPKDSSSTSTTKRNENLVYRGCGCVMLAGLATIPLAKVVDAGNWLPLLAESIAVVAFGIAWLVKSLPGPIVRMLGAPDA